MHPSLQLKLTFVNSTMNYQPMNEIIVAAFVGLLPSEVLLSRVDAVLSGRVQSAESQSPARSPSQTEPAGNFSTLVDDSSSSSNNHNHNNIRSSARNTARPVAIPSRLQEERKINEVIDQVPHLRGRSVSCDFEDLEFSLSLSTHPSPGGFSEDSFGSPSPNPAPVRKAEPFRSASTSRDPPATPQPDARIFPEPNVRLLAGGLQANPVGPQLQGATHVALAKLEHLSRLIANHDHPIRALCTRIDRTVISIAILFRDPLTRMRDALGGSLEIVRKLSSAQIANEASNIAKIKKSLKVQCKAASHIEFNPKHSFTVSWDSSALGGHAITLQTVFADEIQKLLSYTGSEFCSDRLAEQEKLVAKQKILELALVSKQRALDELHTKLDVVHKEFDDLKLDFPAIRLLVEERLRVITEVDIGYERALVRVRGHWPVTTKNWLGRATTINHRGCENKEWTNALTSWKNLRTKLQANSLTMQERIYPTRRLLWDLHNRKSSIREQLSDLASDISMTVDTIENVNREYRALTERVEAMEIAVLLPADLIPPVSAACFELATALRTTKESVWNIYRHAFSEARRLMQAVLAMHCGKDSDAPRAVLELHAQQLSDCMRLYAELLPPEA